MAKIPFHFTIADKVMNLVAQGTHRSTTVDKLEGGSITQLEVDIKSFQLPGEIFISSSDIYNDLSATSIKMIIRIQQELTMNNPLWHCPDRNNSRNRAALAELKRKSIIEPIDGTDIFIVNPVKIRKGRPLAIYGALYSYAKRMYLKDKKWMPTTADILRLKSTTLDITGLEIEASQV